MLSLLLGFAVSAAPPPDPDAKARALVEQLAAGDYAGAVQAFDPKMTQALPAPKLAEAWGAAAKARGRYVKARGVRLETIQGLRVATVNAEHEHGLLDVRVVFDGQGRVAGLFFKPVEDASGAPAREAAARALIDQLARGDFDAAEKSFDEKMAAALPAKKLADTWNGLTAKAGPFRSIQNVREEAVGPYVAVLAGCAFARSPLTVKVVLDGSRRVAGLFFLPGDVYAPWTPPAYADASSYSEKDVSVGPVHLPGTLTLPKGDGPFPAIVLVHGSGPNDRDESVGGAKVFKDLAWGLASRKVAVLRYDKRTRVSPAGVKTVKEESIDDALAGVELLRHQAGVDPKRIYVLGHSLGGTLAPWIARDDPRIAGAVLMAAAARPLMDLVVEQYQYFLSLQPGDAEASRALEEVKAMRARTLAADLKPDEEVFHAPGAYWIALRDYRPAETAAALRARLLVLQGERDYQVSFARDFSAFQKALAARKSATLKSYPALNHLFVPGEGPSTPQEYERPGHVDPVVLVDIATWVNQKSVP